MPNQLLNIGIELIAEMTVTYKDTANAYGSGLVEVFATPAMVAFIEKTCLQLVEPFLDNDESTVGTEICVQHVKATAVNQTVWCKAQLVQVEGRKLTYNVRAWDNKATIGSGTHTRYIINRTKFMEKLQQSV